MESVNMTCLRQISNGVFVCTVTSVILYESFLGHSHEHTPGPLYFSPPQILSPIVGTATVGSFSTGTT